jgi:uncharacterized protein (DUF433 family)
MSKTFSEHFPLITADADTLSGKPRIRNTRISVRDILEMIADGATREEMLESWPELTPEAIEQAVLFAAYCMDTRAAERIAG